MEAVSYSSFRGNLKRYMRMTRDDADVVLVTNNDPTENVVVINARDYESMMETLRVYENPPLLDKVMRGMAQASAGGVAEHALSEEPEAALA